MGSLPKPVYSKHDNLDEWFSACWVILFLLLLFKIIIKLKNIKLIQKSSYAFKHLIRQNSF